MRATLVPIKQMQGKHIARCTMHVAQKLKGLRAAAHFAVKYFLITATLSAAHCFMVCIHLSARLLELLCGTQSCGISCCGSLRVQTLCWQLFLFLREYIIF